MAPKPFNPPRPRNASFTKLSTKTTDRRNHRTSVGEKTNGTTSESMASIETRTEEKDKDNNQSKSEKAQMRTTQTVRLPSLSPLTSDASGDEIENENQEADEDDYASPAAMEMEELLDDTFASDVETSMCRLSHSNRLNMHEEQTGDENEELNEIIYPVSESEVIPRDLISVLLNEMLNNRSSISSTTENPMTEAGAKVKNEMRMTKQAVGAVAKYLDTFVREAVARAAWEGVERGGTGILEVEDLERLAPQLVLDF